jgi:peroxin-4
LADGRWLLYISIPANYPLHPPVIRFGTPVVHANVALVTGEICLDLLRHDSEQSGNGGARGAWSPAYSILECVRAIRVLLSCPEPDSPLNVEVAALLRAGDTLAARRLVELWITEDGGRYNGP